MKKYVNLLNLFMNKNCVTSMARLALIKFDGENWVRDTVAGKKPIGSNLDGEPMWDDNAEVSTIEVPLGALQAALYRIKDINLCDSVLPKATEDTYKAIFSYCVVDLDVVRHEANDAYEKANGTLGIYRGVKYDYNVTAVELVQGLEGLGDDVFAGDTLASKRAAGGKALAARLQKRQLIEQEEADKAKKVEKK